MTIVLYGIPNCDTVKKARTWLAGHAISFHFHDYKKAGITAEQLEIWAKAHGWEKLLNKAGTTFRKLSVAQKADLDQAKAIALMVEMPSLIKRPIVDTQDRQIIGFKPDEYAEFFKTV